MSAPAEPQTDERAAFRKARMARIRVNAMQLRTAMLDVLKHDREFTKVYCSVVRSEEAWHQLMLDLETLAGLARMEE